MGEVESLFLVLALIYGVESAIWVRWDAVSIVLTWGGRWRLARPLTWSENPAGRLLFRNPLPPLGTVLFCHPWPVSVSAHGVYSYVAQAQNPGGRPRQEEEYLRFEDIQSVTVSGRQILINGGVFVRAGSAQYARRFADFLRSLIPLSVADRENAIEAALAGTMDAEEISNCVKGYLSRTVCLRFTGNLLFLYIFLLAPLAWLLSGWGRSWLPLALGLLTALAVSLVEYHRLHKSLYPRDVKDRWSHLAMMVLSPPIAVRARDLLSRSLLDAFHPLAAAHMLLPKEAFVDFARRVMLDLSFPIAPVCPTEETGPQEIEQWFRNRLRTTAENLIRQGGLSPEALLKPPALVGEDSRSYCPRCRCQFTVTEGGCPDCGGLPLQPLVA